MIAITRLEPSDSITVDCSVVTALFRIHGAIVAEDMIMGQIVELTDGISALDDLGADAAAPCKKDKLCDLATLAGDIGLTSLAQALAAVAQATAADNRMALPALWDRVKRIGDRSLVQLWDLPQLRI